SRSATHDRLRATWLTVAFRDGRTGNGATAVPTRTNSLPHGAAPQSRTLPGFCAASGPGTPAGELSKIFGKFASKRNTRFKFALKVLRHGAGQVRNNPSIPVPRWRANRKG